ncbi:alpha/beta fold hydrolase [Amycolatopsis thermoflava]|uniref:alpha/beta fold hydrolase n=1 Tax=Amycolatopsis thermoflava TaxID=84480 RepID=UPI003D735460
MSATTWTGMSTFEDTALDVTNIRGPDRSVRAWTGQRQWRRSRRSADCSFEACGRDLDATGVERPILVGWSYGATLAAHWAARNPQRVAGVVTVDGAMPYGLTGEEGQERIRQMFHRMRFLLPLARPFGLAARMSAEQHAEVNGAEEMEASRASLEPVLARNPNLRISAKVAGNHSKILQKDFRTFAEAVREVAAGGRVAR